MHETILLAEQTRAVFEAFPDLGDDEPSRPLLTLAITAMHFQLGQVACLWERPDKEGYGIPTLVALIDHPSVHSVIRDRLGNERTEAIREAVAGARQVENGPDVTLVRNKRNRDVAHRLFRTSAEIDGPLRDPEHAQVEHLIAQARQLMTVFSSQAAGVEVDWLRVHRAEHEDMVRVLGCRPR